MAFSKPNPSLKKGTAETILWIEERDENHMKKIFHQFFMLISKTHTDSIYLSDRFGGLDGTDSFELYR